MTGTIAEYVESFNKEFADRIAIVYRKEFRRSVWTYSMLHDYVHKIAGFFEQKKIKKNDKVIIYSYNSPEWVGTLLACAITGVVAVPIDFNANRDFAKKIFSKVKAKAAFTSKYHSLNLKQEYYFEDYNKLLHPIRKDFKPKTKIVPKDLFEIVYTSGTTSDPKGVMISNENIVSNLQGLNHAIPLNKNHRFLSMLPLSHLFEQTTGLMIPLQYGGRIVYIHSRKGSVILSALKEEGITTLVTVPAFLETIKNRIIASAKEEGKLKLLNKLIKITNNFNINTRRKIFFFIWKKIGKLKTVFVGGSALDENIESFWRSIGLRVLTGYGMTEASPVISVNTFEKNALGSVGIPLPNVDIKIENDEILVKGPNVFSGYYKNIKETKNTFNKGWLKTGDLGKFKNEFLHLIGRKKNMILSASGLNVYPEDIEKILLQEKSVKDCCVLGIKEKNKVLITAVITGTKDNSLITRVNNKLSSHQKIQKIVYWNGDFPRTPTLKIKKGEVEAKIGKTNSNNKYDNKLYELIQGIIGNKKITSNKYLVNDLGLDSLSRVELVSQIEEELGSFINEEEITSKTTVKDLEKMIDAGKSKREVSSLTWLNINKSGMILRGIIQPIALYITKIFVRVKVYQKHHLHTHKQYVIVANHSSHLDIYSLLSALPYNLRIRTGVAAAKDYFFDRTATEAMSIRQIKTWLFRLIINAYPFARKNNIKNGLKLTGKLLDSKQNVIIFPEGTRSITGTIQEFKPGIGLIASQLETVILPARIFGAYDLLPKGKSFPKKGKIKVIFGEPLIFGPEENIHSITKKIENAVKNINELP